MQMDRSIWLQNALSCTTMTVSQGRNKYAAHARIFSSNYLPRKIQTHEHRDFIPPPLRYKPCSSRYEDSSVCWEIEEKTHGQRIRDALILIGKVLARALLVQIERENTRNEGNMKHSVVLFFRQPASQSDRQSGHIMPVFIFKNALCTPQLR